MIKKKEVKRYSSILSILYIMQRLAVFIVDLDRTGVIMVSMETNNTYDVKKAKQVFIFRKNEKRAFTPDSSSGLGGKTLAGQNIWKR